MNTFQAFILGIVQALTEFLPISSSAHLEIIPWFFNWNNIPKSYDIALHFGTLLAIGIFFFKDWLNLIKAGFNNVLNKKTKEGNMFWYIVLATIPGGIIGFILDKKFENLKDFPLVIAIALMVMGIVLYFVDKYSKSNVEYKNMTLKQTIIIGISQALAFIPGVSRSGITTTTGRFLGVTRESAARFSFMLATPITFAATVFKLNDFTSAISEVGYLSFFVGILTSFVLGLFVIKFLLNYLKKGSFKVFAIYRVLIGITIIIFLMIK